MTDYLGFLDPQATYSPLPLLKSEMDVLSQVVKDASFQLKQRKGLQSHHAALIFQRQLALESQMLNTKDSVRLSELEGRLEGLKGEKVRMEATAQKDILELKKTLWHYSINLYKKQAQIRFVSQR